MSEVFMSSESIQRQHSIDVFSQAEKEKGKEKTSEVERLKGMIDVYIAKHSNTVSVRKEAEEKNRDKSYQLDLSADLVVILEKIKSELR